MILEARFDTVQGGAIILGIACAFLKLFSIVTGIQPCTDWSISLRGDIENLERMRSQSTLKKSQGDSLDVKLFLM